MIDPHEFDDLLNIDEEVTEPPHEWKVVGYGWTPFKLFYKDKLMVGRWKLPLYSTPFVERPNFEMLTALPYLKYGDMYIRIEFAGETDPVNILTANLAIKGYQAPGYLQKHENDPDMDEHFKNRDKELEKWRRDRDLGLHRKKILQQLMDREKKIRKEIKEREDELRKELLDDLRKKLEEEIEIRKKELDELERRLREEFRKKDEDIRRMEVKKRMMEENQKKVDEKRQGLKITITQISGFKTFDQVKIVYGIFLDNTVMHDDFGERMLYETVLYPYTGNRKKRKKAKPPLRKEKITDQPGEFIKNIKGLVLLNKGSRKVYLGFKMIYIEKKRRKRKKKKKLDENGNEIEEDDLYADLPELPKPPESEVAGWTYWEVSKSNGDLKSSSTKKTENLYNPPLLLLPYKKTKLKKSTKKIEFYCQKLDYEPASLPLIYELRRKGKEKKEKQKNVKLDKFDKKYKEPFIPNIVPNWENRAFDKGSGIDLYIDSCRFLPDNVTVTKIIVRIIDPFFNDFTPVQAGLPELGSDILNPIYNYRDELRFPSFDPTLMVFITYLTFDSRGKRNTPQITGFSLFNLF